MRLQIPGKECFSLLNKTTRKEYVDFFQIPDIKNFLQVNYYNEIYYINKEQWEEFLNYLFIVEFFRTIENENIESLIGTLVKKMNFLKGSAKKVGYDLTKLISEISG